MNEIATAIASAVEEQGSATQEIARNVQQAALGTNEITSNVSGVQQAAGDTGAAAHQVLEASSELSQAVRDDAKQGRVLPQQHQGRVIFQRKPAPHWLRGGCRFGVQKTHQSMAMEPRFRFNRNGNGSGLAAALVA